MAYLWVKQKVADFDQWLSVFESHTIQHEASGLADPQILRDVDDPNVITCLFKVTDIAKAKAFISVPAVEKEQHDSSIIGKPEIKFLEES